MRRRVGFAIPISVVGLLAAIAVAGCAGDSKQSQPAAKLPADRSELRERVVVTDKDFDHDNFTHAARIDNRWFPLTPGTQFVYEGHANRGGGLTNHQVIFTVTDLTKMVDGVRTLVLWDRDINAGRLVEGELAFHAQDDDGNVWNFGEYPEEWNKGHFEGAPDSWLTGTDGARAGILMRAEPRLRTPSYLQGWAPKIDFSDAAKVVKTRARTCVPVNCFGSVLVTKEWNMVEKGAHQLKYYARGVGNIRVGADSTDKEGEVLVLARVVRLSPAQLAKARAAALELDKRARVARKDLFGQLPPAQRLIEE